LKRLRVTILGAGFAGLACANALDARRFAVTLVDRRPAFEFLPNIHELVSNVKRPGDLRLPLADAMRAIDHRFLRGEVTHIDPELRRVRVGRRSLDADFLVVALGAAEADYGVTGVREHALGFKSVDAVRHIHRRLEAVADGRDSRVSIVGGGLEGVEALGEVLRRYRGRLRLVRIVEAQEHLLPGTPEAVQRHIEALCRAHDVELCLGERVERITARGIVLGSGRRRSDVTIWTGGPAPAPLLAESGLAEAGSWIKVRRSLEHERFPGIFVAGDAAQPPTPVSEQAYHALDMGRRVAANLERAADGKRPRAYRPSPKPTLLAFGDMDTVLITERVALAGPALAVGKEGVFTGVMAGLDRRTARQRGAAAVERGLRASQRLLWPSLRDLATLRRRAHLKLLK